MGIRAWHDGDGVRAARVDVDQRDTGRCVSDAHAVERDAVVLQQRERRIRERVMTDGAKQRNARSRAACCERLVRALATGQDRERVRGLRLARTRQVRDADDQIEIDRSEDDNH